MIRRQFLKVSVLFPFYRIIPQPKPKKLDRYNLLFDEKGYQIMKRAALILEKGFREKMTDPYWKTIISLRNK